jgi:exopolysaccharide biosynthesis predicted pyruvyltransferase EpsI
MWHEIHAFRLQVLRDFPQVPIVQLPQTIYFDDETHVQEIAELIRTHSSYTLLARSQVSYKFALQHFSANVHLCPDMAFFIGKINSSNLPHLDYFVLARTDHEKATNLLENIKSHYETSKYETTDWLQPSWQERLLHRIEIHTKFLRHRLDPHNKALLCLWNQLSYLRLKRGISLLSRGRIVVTDRLHVHILSILLNKPHLIIDNVYGKLGDFYKTWTYANAETVFVKDLANIIIATNELELSIDQKINTVRASK